MFKLLYINRLQHVSSLRTSQIKYKRKLRNNQGIRSKRVYTMLWFGIDQRTSYFTRRNHGLIIYNIQTSVTFIYTEEQSSNRSFLEDWNLTNSVNKCMIFSSVPHTSQFGAKIVRPSKFTKPNMFCHNHNHTDHLFAHKLPVCRDYRARYVWTPINHLHPGSKIVDEGRRFANDFRDTWDDRRSSRNGTGPLSNGSR